MDWIATRLAAAAQRRLDAAVHTHARERRIGPRPKRALDVEVGGRPTLPRPLP
jgi:hypothetical protein